MNKQSLYIIIPAYNEEENIIQVIDEWYQVIDNHQTDDMKSKLIIINDGSKDNTLSKALERAKMMPNCIVLDKPNSGHAKSCMYGYRYALDNNAEYIFQTDSDRQTNPDEFEPFWDNRSSDVVMGFRKSRGDGVGRLVISRTLRLVNLLLFRVKVKDANVPYRLMSATALKKACDVVPEDCNLGNVVLTVAFEKLGYRIKWLPITFAPREGGASMYNMKKFIKIGLDSIREFYRINKILDKKVKK